MHIQRLKVNQYKIRSFSEIRDGLDILLYN